MADAAESLQTLYDAFGRVAAAAALARAGDAASAAGAVDAAAITPVQEMFSMSLREVAWCAGCEMESHGISYETNFLSASRAAHHPSPPSSRFVSHLTPSPRHLPPPVVPAASLREATARDSEPPLTLESRLARVTASEPKSCDRDKGGCGRLVHPAATLVRRPAVFTLSLVWAASQASEEDVGATMGALATTLVPAAAFPQHARSASAPAQRAEAERWQPRHALKALVCYYGSHYLCFALVPPDGAQPGGWTRFDDGAVTRVGGWEGVCLACARGHLQPTVLFYEAPRA